MDDFARGSLWEYVGQNAHEKGILHMLIYYDAECMITWGAPLNFKRATTMRAGDTWMSPCDGFFKNFKPAVSGRDFSFV